MTHDELLAVINQVIADDVHPVATQTAQALLAVVELHRPNELSDIVLCHECNSDMFGAAYIYPCPTIQAVEEKLA